jgi:hypothetical protein
MTTLPHLRALLERATPAPWSSYCPYAGESVPAGFSANEIARVMDNETSIDIVAHGVPKRGRRQVENAEMIVALRNLAPKLLAVVEAAEELLYYSFDADSSKERGPLLRALEALEPP